MGEAIEQVKGVSNTDSFNSVISSVRIYMKEIGMNTEKLIELDRKAYYLRNEYSEKDTKEWKKQKRK